MKPTGDVEIGVNVATGRRVAVDDKVGVRRAVF